MDVSLNTFSSSVSKAAHQMFSLARTILQHQYLVQTVSCKERPQGHGHANQVPWVDIHLADQQWLPHVSSGFIWEKDHLMLQRSATTHHNTYLGLFPACKESPGVITSALLGDRMGVMSAGSYQQSIPRDGSDTVPSGSGGVFLYSS